MEQLYAKIDIYVHHSDEYEKWYLREPEQARGAMRIIQEEYQLLTTYVHNQ